MQPNWRRQAQVSADNAKAAADATQAKHFG